MLKRVFYSVLWITIIFALGYYTKKNHWDEGFYALSQDFIENWSINNVPHKRCYKVLNVHETYKQFRKALREAQCAVLIESPWIKQACNNYLPDIEALLKKDVHVIILFGNQSSEKQRKRRWDNRYSNNNFSPWEESPWKRNYENAEKAQYEDALKALRALDEEDDYHLTIVSLPNHLRKKARRKRQELTGTHRKLVIVDDKYFITGSFNFLSFDYERYKNNLSNEESVLIRCDVKEKWESVAEEYGLDIIKEVIIPRLKSCSTSEEFNTDQ